MVDLFGTMRISNNVFSEPIDSIQDISSYVDGLSKSSYVARMYNVSPRPVKEHLWVQMAVEDDLDPVELGNESTHHEVLDVVQSLDALADAQTTRDEVSTADSESWDSASSQAALDEVARHAARMDGYRVKLKAVKLSLELLVGLRMFDKKFGKVVDRKACEQRLFDELIDFDKSALVKTGMMGPTGRDELVSPGMTTQATTVSAVGYDTWQKRPTGSAAYQSLMGNVCSDCVAECQIAAQLDDGAWATPPTSLESDMRVARLETATPTDNMWRLGDRVNRLALTGTTTDFQHMELPASEYSAVRRRYMRPLDWILPRAG